MNYFIDGLNILGGFVPINLLSMAALSTAGGYILDIYKTHKLWETIFTSCGLHVKDKIPQLIKTEKNEIGHRYIFNIPIGLCLEDFEKRKSEIETAVHEPVKCILTNDYKLTVQTCNLKYKNEYKPVNVPMAANNLTFPIGVSLTPSGEKYIALEFNRSNSHMLVCGMTGKGKTVFMRNVMVQAMLKKNTDVYICDLKSTGSYNSFKSCKNLIKLVKSIEDTNKILTDMLQLMRDRYKLLDNNNCSDQEEYNKKKGKMKNVIVVIEEFLNVGHDKKAIDNLNILLAQASGAGIHIFLTIQRPDAKNLDTRLKSNLSYTVAFKAKNSSNSEVYLDKGDFRAYTDLHEKGEAILLTDSEDIYFKSYYLTNDEIEAMVKHTFIEKTDPAQEEKPNKIINLKQLKFKPKDTTEPKLEDIKEVDLL